MPSWALAGIVPVYWLMATLPSRVLPPVHIVAGGVGGIRPVERGRQSVNSDAAGCRVRRNACQRPTVRDGGVGGILAIVGGADAIEEGRTGVRADVAETGGVGGRFRPASKYRCRWANVR